jgi:hypothetical protein
MFRLRWFHGLVLISLSLPKMKMLPLTTFNDVISKFTSSNDKLQSIIFKAKLNKRLNEKKLKTKKLKISKRISSNRSKVPLIEKSNLIDMKINSTKSHLTDRHLSMPYCKCHTMNGQMTLYRNASLNKRMEGCVKDPSFNLSYINPKKTSSEFICGRWYSSTRDDLKNAFSRSAIQFFLLYNSTFLWLKVTNNK